MKQPSGDLLHVLITGVADQMSGVSSATLDIPAAPPLLLSEGGTETLSQSLVLTYKSTC